MVKEYNEGGLSEELAIELNKSFREKPNSPEEVNAEDVDSYLDFINDDQYLENFIREKQKKDVDHEETKKVNQMLSRELDKYKEKEREEMNRRKDKEQEERDRKKEKELEENSIEYAIDEWSKYREKQFSDLWYFILVCFITVIPIAVAVLLKVIAPLNEWMQSIGNYQYFIWAGIILTQLFEVLGRSYLFKKDRIQNGSNWLKSLLQLKLEDKKSEKIIEFKSQFGLKEIV